ncbi:hypothetical protein SeMB42_g06376 [Synchytrium endobioticum]|uniref:Nuclear rim protein 1 n=1 Tax=Synchytrium endobioticum TaxID=286115 RepID=A0A507CE36_9FUNG|nr:hypothetical protein SeMB42_g06376 [Synchytrium endobioticum]TPX45178.1 hypothetical protein SeLEV6574_g04021 [Synchytrium endobioticum]
MAGVVEAAKQAPRMAKRRSSVWSRITSFPGDLYLRIAEEVALMDFESYIQRGSKPIVVAFNLLFLVIRYMKDYSNDEQWKPVNWSGSGAIKHDDDFISSRSNTHYSDPHSWSYFTFWTALEIMLWLIALGNTVYLFCWTKTYIFFKRKRNDSVKSRNAKLVWVDTQGTADDTMDDDDELDRPDQLSGRRLKWRLNVWEPPEWALTLFCGFSPPQLLMLWSATADNWKTSVLSAGLTSLFFYLFTSVFNDKINDKTILGGELLQEFTTGFVYKQTPFLVKKDEAVGTEDVGVCDDDIIEEPVRTITSSRNGFIGRMFTPAAIRSDRHRRFNQMDELGDEDLEEEDDEDVENLAPADTWTPEKTFENPFQRKHK